MKKFAVFDIDGTLIRWQLYHAVADRLAKKGLLGEDTHTKLHEARMVWKRREYPKAYPDYEQKLIAAYEAALPALDVKTFDEIAAEVAEEYKTQVYTYTRDLISKLKQKGYMLLAISGSHEELIRHIAAQYGFDDWIATKYERKNGRFTGKHFIASHDKKLVLEKLIQKHNLDIKDSYGVGDTKSDIPLLAAVEHAIAFNPDFELLQAAQKNSWKIVVERKSNIYELEQRDGTYVLAQTTNR